MAQIDVSKYITIAGNPNADLVFALRMQLVQLQAEAQGLVCTADKKRNAEAQASVERAIEQYGFPDRLLDI